ncbi:esterase [Lysinibacillus yapensis]|uniref:Esterase n=1 Tax=Ureibacillus yapensis TaxID=2304605 RepID=A0A396SEK2_9BACL|nr:dienelactone hydrolase family protein [Lysinibacillus yapensis]RHW36652.1 esterase [Lysinibacillus yapensis]
MNTEIIYTVSEPIEKNRETYPAIFLMHGMGSNENDLPAIVKEMEKDYYIFSLRGPLSQGPGYAFFTIERIGKPHEEPFRRILKDVQTFLEEATKHYPIDPQKIYLLGFSQGAILSQSLATILGNQLAGIVSIGGYLPELALEGRNKVDMNGLQVLLAHGEQDPVIPFEWSEKSKDFFETEGAQVKYFPYTGGHFVTPQLVEEIEEYFHNTNK